jgi:hypothetical protein
MKKKRAELTIEAVVIFLIGLGLLVIAIFIIMKNKSSMDKISNFFRGIG